MSSSGRRSPGRRYGRGPGGRPGWHGPGGWHGSPWQEEFIAEYEPRFRMPAAARLWLPVLLSFLAQVPASIVLWRTREFAFLDNGSVGQLLFGVGIALVGPVALIAARRFPGPIVVIVSAAASIDLFMGDQRFGPPYLALAFAIGSAVVRGARIWAWISVGAAWLVTITVGAIVGAELQPGRIAGTTLGILIVFGLAESMRTRRERISAIRSRVAARKQSEVQAERVRIARELHDVLAHSLSQINVQAGVGLHLLDKQPEKAAEALASIKETSKQALDEVRSVLGVLRAEGGADPSAPLVPEPDLSRLAGLAASVTSQGVDVTLTNDLADVPAPVQLALYRIVQESLTNVVRHANATRATVRLDWVHVDTADAAYRVTVSDNGAGPGSGHASPTSEGGRGLLGMRERAELLGGHLTAGPGVRGFTVVATIPRTERA